MVDPVCRHLRWKVLRKANGKLSEEAAVAFGPADDMKLPAAVIADFDAPFASYLCSLLSCKNVEVGRCKLDPGFKAPPRSQKFDCKKE